MSKEYVWHLPVGDAEKEITCEMDGNKYFIYIGDAFVTTFYKNSSGDVDEEITLCGVPCRFVAFADKPDLLIEGTDVLLGSGKSYSQQKNARKKGNTVFAFAELFIGLFALAGTIAMSVSKGSFADYIFAFILPIAFIILGIFDLYNLNRKKQKKNPATETKKDEEI